MQKSYIPLSSCRYNEMHCKCRHYLRFSEEVYAAMARYKGVMKKPYNHRCAEKGEVNRAVHP
jgi:hypothetical protein